MFGKSLLAYVVALVVGGSALAQNPLQEGVTLLRLGGKDAAEIKANKEKALLKFQEALKGDPSNEQALALYRSVDQDVWFMLLSEGGEIQKIAASILERAKMETKTRSRDAGKIDALVAEATSPDTKYDARRAATTRLIADHGEFAVPALVQKLGNADDANGQVASIFTLSELGHTAVLPLIEALKTSNGTQRLNAAAALSQIGDDRAAPAMARLAESDPQENVREVARRFLAKHEVKGKAADLMVAAARNYLRNGVGQGAFSDVIWTSNNGKLEAKDVPSLLYPIELAKACAEDAMACDPLNQNARSLVAQGNLAAAYVIETSAAQGSEQLKPLEGLAAEFKLTALATGTPTLRAALDEGIATGTLEVTMGAIDALGLSEDRDSVAGSSLLKALDSGDKRVSYAAAIAVTKACGGNSVPAADKVVGLLAQAVTEQSVRHIQVIDNSAEAARAAAESGAKPGSSVACAASLAIGVDAVLRNPNVDVVVINEILPDQNRLPEDLIRIIRKDPRLGGVKILIAAKNIDNAKTRFGDSVNAVIQAPISGATLDAAVTDALKDAPVEPRNARAESIAKSASESLLALASARGNVSGALGSLAAQLNRGDAVAIPAAKAIGLSGNNSQLEALLAAAGGTGSVDLKCASIDAIGMILARAGDCPANVVAGLTGIVSAEGEIKVRTAAANALGKAKLADGDKAKLIHGLQKVGSTAPKS
jgi:HEAT repeat protein